MGNVLTRQRFPAGVTTRRAEPAGYRAVYCSIEIDILRAEILFFTSLLGRRIGTRTDAGCAGCSWVEITVSCEDTFCQLLSVKRAQGSRVLENLAAGAAKKCVLYSSNEWVSPAPPKPPTQLLPTRHTKKNNLTLFCHQSSFYFPANTSMMALLLLLYSSIYTPGNNSMMALLPLLYIPGTLVAEKQSFPLALTLISSSVPGS